VLVLLRPPGRQGGAHARISENRRFDPAARRSLGGRDLRSRSCAWGHWPTIFLRSV